MRTRRRRQAQQASYFAAPPDVAARLFRVGHRTFAELRWSAGGDPVLPAALSVAEQEVARLALSGLTNAEIAVKRGTATRTVANQMARVFDKCGVRSRHELLATVLRRKGSPWG